MANTPTEVLQVLLEHPTNPYVVNALVAQDAQYDSLNLDAADLAPILPWARSPEEPGTLHQALIGEDRNWANETFDITDILGQGPTVAVFGSFTYRSTVTGTQVTTALAILATVHDGQVTHMRFMQDTFATARAFHPNGACAIHTDPTGTTEA